MVLLKLGLLNEFEIFEKKENFECFYSFKISKDFFDISISFEQIERNFNHFEKKFFFEK